MLGFLKRWNLTHWNRRRANVAKPPRRGRVLAEELVVLDPGAPAETSRLEADDSITEQFRAVRANLLAIPREQRPRLLVVTASQSGEGTSTTIHRLGASLAERGDLRVLLVDANLRDPALGEFLDDVSSQGLSDMLRGEASAEDCIGETVIENLDILPCGGATGNPAELLSLPATRACLRELRDDYDFVLVDTPAVGEAADAAIVAKHCDSAILVVQLHTTPKETVAKTLDHLRQAGVSITGCVITGEDETAQTRRGRRYGEAARA